MLKAPPKARPVMIFFILSFLIAARAQTDPSPSADTAAGSVVTFNEVMYHPANDPDCTEWLELHNQMSVNLDISNWRITGGVGFQFPSNTVFAANSYLVVAAHPERLRDAGLPDVFGPLTGRLSGNDTVRLRNQNGRLLDELSYLDHDPWPVGADGSGATLSKHDRFLSSRPAVNWRASAQAGGTPGRENFPGAAGPPPLTNDLGSNPATPTELVNVALNKTVIDGSGAYSDHPFDVPDAVGNFIAQNVTDGSTADEFGVSYWLGREGTVNEYFILDLGGSVQIQEIHLRNTHNTDYNDRGTAKFQIDASESIDASRQLVQPRLILSGTLKNVSGLSPIPAEVFAASNGLVVTNARYLRFTALTAGNPGRNVGLNEMEVYAPVIAAPSATRLAFSEVAGLGHTPFFVELANDGPSGVPLSGCKIVSSSGASVQLGSNDLAPGALLALTSPELGFPVGNGDRLFLLGPDGGLIDAVEVQRRARARVIPTPDAPWCYPSRETPGKANEFSFHREIVINEIMYHHAPSYRTREAPFAENDEQWIELYNLSSNSVDLGAWQLDGAVSLTVPSGTLMPPDSYLVIANNPTTLRANYPGIAVLGLLDGRLSHHDAHIVLRDASGNIANEVHYWNAHPWPAYANGGGSSLELRDPRADNSVAEAWGASVEGGNAPWRHYSYRATAVRPVYSPQIYSFHEFRMGLLDLGEALINNVSVTELTSPPRQLLQNSDFTAGTAHWRLLGNHSHSVDEPNPDDSANRVLHLVATGNTSYLDNRLETTLKSGTALVPVVTGRQYEIAFDAKWLAGSPQLHTELYYNKVAATTLLEMPSPSGTPGRRNSIYTPNSGPTYRALVHSPVVPRSTDKVTVAIRAADPDGVAALALFYSVNAGAWIRIPMTRATDDPAAFTAVLPAQANGAVIQIYIEGTDTLGAVSTYPAAGRSSRALIKVDSPRLGATKQTLRTIMTPADSALLHSPINMMSDDLLGCTVVHQEREVFYDARIRLHGSMFSRNSPATTGFTIKFPGGHPWRGGRESVVVRRGALVENFIKHILNSAGGLPGNYDDVVNLVSHRLDNQGTARVILANDDDTFLESQFENDHDGTVFKLEGIREYQTTQNGSPEGLKLSQPIGWIDTFDTANLGDDPEQYRWGILIQNQRPRDDYSRIVAMGKAFSLTGAALKQAASDTIDVDEWARLFALQSLLGIADIYGVENPHNFAFYVRPSDGRVMGLQNDWQFAFALSSNASIYGSKNVYRVLRLPGFQRVYQGHLLDLIESVVNSAYVTPWARHYSTVMGEGYTGYPGYLAARGTSVRSQLAPKIPFEIQTNNGLDFTVDASSVTLGGRGWIDVYHVYRTGQSNPVPIVWLDNEHWQATFPLAGSSNRIELRAFNFRGVQVGEDSISVSSTVTEFPQREYLRISEVMYHPRDPGPAELNAGFTDPDDFEFVEILNTGPVAVSLQGVRFNAGINFDFTSGSISNLLPSECVLVVKNKSAFAFRYGTNLPVAGEYLGSLSNSGELLRLVDSSDGVIQEFVFGDQPPWPSGADGSGYSLEVLNLNGSYDDPTNWITSILLDGTPGYATSARPAFSAVTYGGGQLHLCFTATRGQSYTIYDSGTLLPGHWTPLLHLPPSAESRVEEVLVAPSGSPRFYRISAP